MPNNSKEKLPSKGSFTGIGKTQIDGTVYIGEVDQSVLYVPYKSGEAMIRKYLRIFDKNMETSSQFTIIQYDISRMSNFFQQRITNLNELQFLL